MRIRIRLRYVFLAMIVLSGCTSHQPSHYDREDVYFGVRMCEYPNGLKTFDFPAIWSNKRLFCES